ncbi:holin family protein [Clostridium saccharobutylicum]|uniref:phage holin family protein n=1 Tax=Clostridium saccharobutylicum TaxID=169679 RepID=UPI0009839FAC|nr:phage holin family protein [Clostridium saccharobutylicum]AQS10554.1 holin family protein [Clostridium saccharobutylicum]MBC2438089.1 phage holin family protein [Clostridium saccharobutylicum]NSB90453.1 toxin secretion/phage lysis holin [Clostridium saccharobutylicum]NYC31508.1 toxin secretion/phage lysis holin [Clostridium saccharobutylicum]OOM18827.1 holin family protein [Clostridium saccharobutylicum]
MENIARCFKTVIAILGTVFTWLFGAWDTALIVLVTFIVTDYLTGVLRGYITKKLSSDVGLKGIARKAVIFSVLIVAVSLDRLLNNGTWVFRTLVCYFYIANEGLSLIENAISMGVPAPPGLKNALIQLKDGEKKEIKE